MSPHEHTPELHEVPDPWHQHSAAEGAPQHEHGAKVNPIFAGLTLLGLVFGTIFLILLVWVYFQSYTTRLKAERQEPVTDVLRTEYLTARANAQTRLAQPATWMDRDAGTVAIPLDLATDLVIRDYARSGAAAPTPQPSPQPSLAEAPAE